MTARTPEWRRWNGRIRSLAKERGLDDDARRDLQRRVTGKESCADMSTAELRRVADAIVAPQGARNRDAPQGARNRVAPEGAPAGLPRGPLTGKLRALWISGWHLGVVRDRTDQALLSWLERQSAIANASRMTRDPGARAMWSSQGAAARAVEALQAWLARDAGVDWRPYIELGRDGETREVERPKARVIEAQWRILHARGVVAIGDLAALAAYACRHAGLGRADSHLALDESQLVELSKDLGRRVRAAPEGGWPA